MLPNVSAIYRDLAYMSDPNSSKNIPSYSAQSSTPNLYSDKQEKHNLEEQHVALLIC